MFCSQCGTKLVDGACGTCTAKSTNGLSFESLEKSLAALEDVSKGVRPAPAKEGEKDSRTAKELVEDVKEQQKKYGQHGEGDSEEQPKTKKNVESVTKKGGFMPPPAPEEDDEEFEPKRRPEPEEEDEQEPEFKSAKSKKAKKSFADALTETSEAVSKAIDISDYLRDFVYAVSESHDALANRVEKSLRAQSSQGEFNVALAVAMKQLGGLVKSLAEKLESFGTQPAAGRKSDVNVVEKSFAGNNAGETLTKSEIAAKLTTMLESGDKSVTVADVLSAEASGFVRPELREKVGLPKA